MLRSSEVAWVRAWYLRWNLPQDRNEGYGEKLTEDGWSDEEFRQKWQEQADSMGRFNLAIFGKTGVGKSTLINAVFGREVARTGIGEPVTIDQHLYLHDSGFLGLLDTRGLEIGTDTETLIRELATYVKAMRKKPLADQVHVAWYCVSSTARRFEDTEADFILRLHELELPVVLVLTQVPSRDGQPHPDAVELAARITERALPIVGGHPMLVMAQRDDFYDQVQHGLQELLDATFLVAPDGVQVALTAAQKVDLSRKWNEAARVVWFFAGLAGAAGAVTKSDAKALAAVQLGMVGKVAAIYGIDLDVATVAWGAATAAVTKGGESAIGGLLKLAPDAGKGAKNAISGGVAGALTLAVGYAWAIVCGQLSQGKLRGLDGMIDNELVRELFVSQFGINFAKKSK